jgi:hypothetical protein
VPEASGQGGQFRRPELVAPQFECTLRFSVRSLEPRPADGAGKGGKPSR